MSFNPPEMSLSLFSPKDRPDPWPVQSAIEYVSIAAINARRIPIGRDPSYSLLLLFFPLAVAVAVAVAAEPLPPPPPLCSGLS